MYDILRGKKSNKIRFQKKLFDSEDYDPPKKINFNNSVKVEVIFKDCAKKYKNIPQYSFTNKSSDIPDSKTLICFEKIKENKERLLNNSKSITIKDNQQGDRLKGILSQYLDATFIDKHSEYFRKSAVIDDFNVKDPKNGRFRVICLYTIKPPEHKKERRKHYLEVILFDPYHLFIPSSFETIIDGKRKWLKAHEAMMHTYDKVKNYSKDFDFFNK